jgi:hypothetical protein
VIEGIARMLVLARATQKRLAPVDIRQHKGSIRLIRSFRPFSVGGELNMKKLVFAVAALVGPFSAHAQTIHRVRSLLLVV